MAYIYNALSTEQHAKHSSPTFVKARSARPILKNARTTVARISARTTLQKADSSAPVITQFTPKQEVRKPGSVSLRKRWLCNVASGVKLNKHVKYGLNVDSRGNVSQYELMVKLLKAETCDVIYFDCQLNHSQIGILKMLQVFSNTELVHARLAMQFDRAMG